MFDLVIEGGTVVSPAASRPSSVAVTAGRVVALPLPCEGVEARRRIDASGKLLLPGLVDAHVHFREPGLSHKEGFLNGTRAAAMGGVTTVMVMPTDVPATLTCNDFMAKRALGEGHVYVDFALQAAVVQNLSEIERLASLGAVSFEIFPGASDAHLRLDDGAALIAALQAIGTTGRICGISPGEATLVTARIDAARIAGRLGFLDFAAARPQIGEAMSLTRCAVAAGMLGVTAIFRQVSCGAALDSLHDARRRWPNIFGETNPHYLTLTDVRMADLCQNAVMSPPLRPESDRRVLCKGLRDGTLDIVSSDHAPHLPEEKSASIEDVWAMPLGIPGVQTLLQVMLAHTADGDWSVNQIVEWCSERPARLFGLFPTKGTIAVGADADVIILDPTAPSTIQDEVQVSRAIHTPFIGLNVPSAIDRVLLRGIVIQNGNAVIGPPCGRFIAPEGSVQSHGVS